MNVNGIDFLHTHTYMHSHIIHASYTTVRYIHSHTTVMAYTFTYNSMVYTFTYNSMAYTFTYNSMVYTLTHALDHMLSICVSVV